MLDMKIGDLWQLIECPMCGQGVLKLKGFSNTLCPHCGKHVDKEEWNVC